MTTLQQSSFSSLTTSDYAVSSTNKKTKEPKETFTHNIAVDAEWHSVMKGFDPKPGFKTGEIYPLTVQYYHEQTGRRIIYVTAEYYDKLQPYADELGIELIPSENLDTGTLDDLVQRLGLENAKIRLLLFYSPTDLRFSFGKSKMMKLYFDKIIVKKRNLRNYGSPVKIANNCTIEIHDLKGWAAGSLAEFSKAVGIEMTSKKDLDDYKSRMQDAINEKPETFLRYSMDDTEKLVEMFHNFVELGRKVQGILGIPQEERFTEETIPQTNGSIVAETLATFIRNQASNKTAFEYAIRKHGILDEGLREHANIRDVMHKLRDNIKTVADLDRRDLSRPLNTLLRSKFFKHTVLEQSGVKYFGSQQETSIYLSIVQGGRCNNERPSEYRVDGAAFDIDMSSCYGSTLKQFTYPIGLPTVIAQNHDEQQQTLAEFLKEHGHELVDNLWEAVVEGELPFRQDLIFSKVVNPRLIQSITINDEFDKGDGIEQRKDVAHMPGDFILSRCQIENGVITSHILEAIKKVSTNTERKAWMNLKVRSAAFYAKSDRLDTMDDWVEEVIQDKGQRTVVGRKHGNTKDNRTRKWYGISLEDFVGRLVVEREHAKALGQVEYQQILKLFVNTTYGVIASPFFSTGNVVVANNITARARLGAWMLNKALHTRQSITDGGGYTPLSVAYRKPHAKRAGFDTLADNTEWVDSRYTRSIAPLAGLQDGQTWDQWVLEVKAHYENIKDDDQAVEDYQKELGNFLDEIAMKHVTDFWTVYKDENEREKNLKFPFKLEHKIKNISTTMSYFRKGDYGFRRVWGGDEFKSRGNKLFTHKPGEEPLKSHPTYQLLRNILDDSDEFPQDMEFNHTHILSPNLWLKAYNSREGYQHIFDAHPGESIVEQRTARYNNLHVSIDRIEDFNIRNKRKKKNHGKSVEYFERYRERGIKAVVRAMTNNHLN